MTDAMLTDVMRIERGSSLLEAAALGVTSITVDDPTGFGEDGDDDGMVEINDQRIEYTSVDADTGVITLAAGLDAAASEGDPVWVVVSDEVATDWIAMCDLGAGEQVEVPLPFAMRAMLPEGQYDPPVPVVLSDDLLTVLDAPGRKPVIEADFVPDAATNTQVIAIQTQIDDAVADYTNEFLQRPLPIRATTDPTGTPVAGQVWEKYDTLGTPRKLLAVWQGDGTNWVPVALDPTYIPVLDINSGTAGALAVERLLIADFTNYIRDAMPSGLGTWVPIAGSPSVAATSSGFDGTAGSVLRFVNAGVAQETQEPPFSVTPGDEFALTLKARPVNGPAPSAGVVYLTLRFYDLAGAQVGGSAGNIATVNANTITSVVDLGGSITVPAGAATARFAIRTSGTVTSGTTLDFGRMSLRRKLGGSLLVDGAMDAKTITGALVTGGVVQTSTGPSSVRISPQPNPRNFNFTTGMVEFVSDAGWQPGGIWGSGSVTEIVAPYAGDRTEANAGGAARLRLQTDAAGNRAELAASSVTLVSQNGSMDFNLWFTDTWALKRVGSPGDGIFVRCSDSTDPNNIVIEARADSGQTIKPLKMRGRTLVLDPMKSIGGTGVQILGLTNATSAMFRLYVDSNGVIYKAATAGL